MPRWTGRICRRCGAPVFRSLPLCENCEEADERLAASRAAYIGELKEWRDDEEEDINVKTNTRS